MKVELRRNESGAERRDRIKVELKEGRVEMIEGTK
jgi:hypothetical protein